MYWPVNWSRGRWLAVINNPRGFFTGLCSNMATDMEDLNEEVHRGVFVVYDTLFYILMENNDYIFYPF